MAVDDDPANVLLLRRMLEQAGYSDVVTTTDSDRAVKLCAEEPTAVLLVDLHMPGPDGFGVMSAVREKPESPAVIVLTGDAFAEVAERARSAGADGVLVKPVDYEELISRVGELVEDRGAG